MASIEDLKRMCEKRECDADCPLWREDKSCLPIDLPDNADEIVDKWVAEHPVKTYAMDFFSKFPDAPRLDGGRPKICIDRLYNVTHHDRYCCEYGCIKCWNQEMRDE